MGKVQSTFGNGYAGAVSRSVDNAIISKRNNAYAVIPFGKPVFLDTTGTAGVVPFDASSSEAAKFVGFTVRIADKTPDAYNSSEGQYNETDPIDILVRGAITLEIGTSTAKPGDNLYIRKSDSKLVALPGSEGTTIQVPNATITTYRDDNGFCEVLLRERNLL